MTGEFPSARVAILMGTKWKQNSSYLIENKGPASAIMDLTKRSHTDTIQGVTGQNERRSGWVKNSHGRACYEQF